jgi:hypothetical protein
MNVQTTDTSPKRFLGGKKWRLNDFFPYKKASKGPQVSTEYFKVNFGQRFGLCQENSCTHETLDYQFEWQKLLQKKRRIYAYGTACNLRK